MRGQNNRWWVTELWKHLPVVEPFGKVNQPGDPGRHFTFRALERNAVETRLDLPNEFLDGTHGVRDKSLIEHYRAMLEEAYASLVAQHLAPPATDSDGMIPVFLWDVVNEGMGHAPFMIDQRTASGLVVPCLFLSSRPRGHDLRAELDQMAIEAVHELRHAFNARQLPHLQAFPPTLTSSGELSLMLESWNWLDEALCVMTEADLHPANLNWISFMVEWVDACACPFHADGHKYQSAMFMRYLRRKAGNDLINKTWQHSTGVWNYIKAREKKLTCDKPHTALTALAEEVSREDQILSHHLKEDLFSKGYCYDSYFCHLARWAGGTNNDGYEKDVHDRFQGQAISVSSRLKPGTPPLQFSLPALSCHYFRLYPQPGASCDLVLSMSCAISDAALRMEAVFVTGDPSVPLEHTRSEATRKGEGWLLTMPNFGDGTHDHVIIILSHAPEIQRSYQDPPAVTCVLVAHADQSGCR